MANTSATLERLIDHFAKLPGIGKKTAYRLAYHVLQAPSDSARALAEARVMQWLAVSENELLTGLARARAARRFNRPYDPEQCRLDSAQGVGAMELRLNEADWLAVNHPTIADLACYPYVNLADEAEFSLLPYPAVRAWLQRVVDLPGWVPML